MRAPKTVKTITDGGVEVEAGADGTSLPTAIKNLSSAPTILCGLNMTEDTIA